MLKNFLANVGKTQSEKEGLKETLLDLYRKGKKNYNFCNFFQKFRAGAHFSRPTSAGNRKLEERLKKTDESQ